jgi:RodZ C-terminal domain
MVWMWIVFVGAVLVAVVAFATVVLRRPRGDDLSSVRNYHSALGTLEHLSERTIRSSDGGTGPADRPDDPLAGPRFYSRQGSGGGVGTTRSVPPVPVKGNDDFPDLETPLVFDDSRPRDRYRRESSTEGVAVSRTDRAQRHALDSMNHRPRRRSSVAVVVAALVLFAVLAIVGSRRSHSPTPTHSANPPTSAVTHHGTPATATGSSHRSGSSARTKGKSKATSGTLPAPVLALSSTPATAIYPVASSPYQLAVSASGPCWVDATTVSTGSTLWTGTLQAGQVQQIQGNGSVRVELGSLAATLTVDDAPVVLPTPTQSPFVATFQPSATAPPTG